MLGKLLVGIYLMCIGISVVFVGLALLQGFTNFIHLLDKLLARLKRKPRADTAIVESETAVTDEERVIIAAAVAEALGGRKAEIHRIRLLDDESQETWSRVGRLDHMRSHNLQSGKK